MKIKTALKKFKQSRFWQQMFVRQIDVEKMRRLQEEQRNLLLQAWRF